MTILLWIAFACLLFSNSLNIFNLYLTWSSIVEKGQRKYAWTGVIMGLFCLTVVFFAAVLI